MVRSLSIEWVPEAGGPWAGSRKTVRSRVRSEPAYLQSTVRTSIGSGTPLRVTVLGPEKVKEVSPTASSIPLDAAISSPSPKPPTLAAVWTPAPGLPGGDPQPYGRSRPEHSTPGCRIPRPDDLVDNALLFGQEASSTIWSERVGKDMTGGL